MNHYERIRAMSLEEVAEYMCRESDVPYCKIKPECIYQIDAPGGIPEENCIRYAKEWLMQEVEE